MAENNLKTSHMAIVLGIGLGVVLLIILSLLWVLRFEIIPRFISIPDLHLSPHPFPPSSRNPLRLSSGLCDRKSH